MTILWARHHSREAIRGHQSARRHLFTMLDAKGGRVKRNTYRPSPEKSFRATRWSKVMNSKKTTLSPSPKGRTESARTSLFRCGGDHRVCPARRSTRCSTRRRITWAPIKGGAKPYRLLAEAMRDADRSAIGRWAARGKQYLVNIRVAERRLILQELLYADEVRPVDEVEIPDENQPKRTCASQSVDRQHHLQGVRSNAIQG